MFIACEGQKGKSEYRYFQNMIEAFPQSNCKKEIRVAETKDNTARELVIIVNRIRKREGLDGDQAWAVFDKDGCTKHHEAFDYAQKKQHRNCF